MNRKRVLGWFGLFVLAVLLGAAHVVIWYLPRAHPGSPRPDSPMGMLLASEAFPVALWMPFPHQNLGFLRQQAGADAASLGALARLAGLPAPELPSFGPLVVPPASAMAIASDEAGQRYAIIADVYPAFAAFARLAGRLAGNPWLEGGEIYLDGRRTVVAWHGNLWSVASPGLPELDPPPAAGGRAAADDPALAVIQVRQAVYPLPAGRYRLVHDGAAFEVLSEVPVERAPDFERLGLGEAGAFLFAFTGRNEALGEPAQALLAFTSSARGSLEMPRVAAIWEPSGERPSLPGEALLEFSGRDPYEAASAGWSVAALDGESLEEAVRLAPLLAALAEPGAGALALWFDLDSGLGELSRIAGRLADIPIVPQRRLERWRDAEAVLTPLAARYSRLTLVVTEEPRAFRLRLEPAAQDEPAS